MVFCLQLAEGTTTFTVCPELGAELSRVSPERMKLERKEGEKGGGREGAREERGNPPVDRAGRREFIQCL